MIKVSPLSNALDKGSMLLLAHSAIADKNPNLKEVNTSELGKLMLLCFPYPIS